MLTAKTPKKKKQPALPALMKKAQIVLNTYVRRRDSSHGFFTCISCGNTKPIDQMNAGHYVPVSRCAYLRFHEWNINGECIGCNCFDEFHLIGYRKRLIDKIGLPAVTWLEDNRFTVHKWTRSGLEELIEKYKD
jgi:hypothetical protein